MRPSFVCMAIMNFSEHKPAQTPSGHLGLVLGCIGVVYGDIGTSPLYAFREAVKAAGGVGTDPGVVFGILSLISWTLFSIVTLKYVLLMLRADNEGEGGILSLMALTQKISARNSANKKYGAIFFMGLIGAALFYGDAMITPSISVLSAVEGMELVSPHLDKFVLPLALVILIGLFVVQKFGTRKVGRLFGPVMVAWFLVIGISGILHIAQMPGIFAALNPLYAVWFFRDHAAVAMPVLGMVFLAVTGAEALYADLGHFGRRAIRDAWILLVFPCLLLNYFGQGALILANPKALENPFFLMLPDWTLIPMVVLAACATVIASQAVISGTFSMTRQAIQLGLLPRLEIRHTSSEHEGQIYMPKINTLLLYGVLFLTCVFGSSSLLASAYGIAVTGTMIVTSLLAYVVMRRAWNVPRLAAAAMIAPFLCIETVFFAANLQKIADGGYVPLMIAAIIIVFMTVWVRGTRHLLKQTHHKTVTLKDLSETVVKHPPTDIPGTALFMTSDPVNAPIALLQNLRHNKVLHQCNIVLTILTAHQPRVDDNERYRIEQISPRFLRITLSFGYAENQDIPRILRHIQRDGAVGIDFHDASFFLGRRSIIASADRPLQEGLAKAWRNHSMDDGHRDGHHHGWHWLAERKHHGHVGLPGWQSFIFIAMANAAVSATDFYRIPRAQVVELGVQMTI